MQKPNQKVESKPESKPQTRPEQVTAADPAYDWTWLARFGGGPLAAAGDGTIDGQSARLADLRFCTIQRQAVASEIGENQGNRHLQQVLAHPGSQHGLPDVPYGAPPRYRSLGSSSTVQRQGGSVTVGAAAETPQKAHGELANEILTLLERDPNLSIREALARAVEARIPTAPTIAHSRDLAAPSSEELGIRRASIIANSNYHPHDTDLESPVDSAMRMQAQLSARGYETSVHHDLRRDAMMGAWLEPLESCTPGDKVVLYYHGHGTTEGLKGVQGQIFGMDRFGVLRERALGQWIDLTIILQACHTGSVTDYFRREEVQSLREHLSSLPSSDAAMELLDMAEDIQRMKDEISALEARKEACLDISEAELEADITIVDRRNAEADALSPQIQALWEAALVTLADYQARILALTGVTLAMPVFPDGHWDDFWTNPDQLDVMSTMVNRILELARGGA